MATILDCNTASTQTDGNRLYLSFTRYSGKWIYCNYPERLPADALGDFNEGNHYLNHVVVNGPAQLFASYVNDTGYDIYFGIQLYNSGSSTISITRQNNGHRHSGTYPNWCDVEGGVWSDFFSNPDGTTFSVSPGKAVWIFEQPVPVGKFFNSMVRFQTNGPLHCFPYVYRSRANINGTATCYPWVSGAKQYRGEGDSYFIETTINLSVSQMPYKYYTCSCGSGNSNEITAIYDPCASAWRSCSSPDNNLGNWGMQYLFKVTVSNDTGSTKRVRAYVGSDGTTGAFSVINYLGTVKWCCRNANEWWNWLVDDIPAGQSRTYEYQFIHAANSYAPIIHGWRLG